MSNVLVIIFFVRHWNYEDTNIKHAMKKTYATIKEIIIIKTISVKIYKVWMEGSLLKNMCIVVIFLR